MNFKAKDILMATVIFLGGATVIGLGIEQQNENMKMEVKLNEEHEVVKNLENKNKSLSNENSQLKIDITNQNKVIVSKDEDLKNKHNRLLYVKNVKNERIEYLKRELKKKPKVIYKTEYKNKVIYKEKEVLDTPKKSQNNVNKVSEKKVTKASNETGDSPTRSVGLSFQMTSYTADCNGCSGITATGLNVKGTTTHNGMNIIAVDPSVIPLGSRVKVTTSSGNTFIATAQDTGEAIKGNIIDLLVSNNSIAQANGRQSVKVEILR